jgi:hypothetical protein
MSDHDVVLAAICREWESFGMTTVLQHGRR